MPIKNIEERRAYQREWKRKRRLEGSEVDNRIKYDQNFWLKIQVMIDQGLSRKEILDLTKISRDTWTSAVSIGKIIVPPKSPPKGRGGLKRLYFTPEHHCSECDLPPVWNDKKLVMVLDHINGINNDNRRENLRLLCPNCNSQTDTFSGRNVRKSNGGSTPSGAA